MHVVRCPKAEYNVRHSLAARPLAVKTAVVALDCELLSLFRPSQSSILWPNETHAHMDCIWWRGGWVQLQAFWIRTDMKMDFFCFWFVCKLGEKSGENRLNCFFLSFYR